MVPYKVKIVFLATTIVELISASAPPFIPTLLKNEAVPSKVMMLDVTAIANALEGLCKNILCLEDRSPRSDIYCYGFSNNIKLLLSAT